MDDAELRHARDVAEFVLVGGGVSGKSVLYTASHMGAQGIQAAESFGIFNVVGMLTRAWTAWRKDPASNQAIIDEGERFLARAPDAPEASDVHERLATAYERAGKYDRALFHYRATAKPDPERVGKLEEKIAEQLWENAEKAGGEPALLAAIIEYYPTTDTAEKARKALKEYPRPGDVKLSRELLLGHPSLLGPTALDLAPALLDGKLANGELADAGVSVSPGTLVLTLRNPDGDDDRTERRPLSPEAYARARAAGEGALYASTLTTDPNAKEVGPLERYIPFFIAGGIDEGGGVSVAPGLKLRPETSEDRPLYQ
jgi:tetratricopeptide (TPR) repeat protein